MRSTLLGLTLGVILATLDATPARAAGHPFGLGLELGAPTGLGAKYYLGGRVAIQGGLGVIERFGDDGIHIYAQMLWHPTILVRHPAFTMPFYLGVGGRLLSHDYHYNRCYDGRNYYVCDDDDTHIGVRVPFGILMDFNKVPMDVFFELAVVVDILHLENGDDRYDHHDDRVGVNAILGGRYYF